MTTIHALFDRPRGTLSEPGSNAKLIRLQGGLFGLGQSGWHNQGKGTIWTPKYPYTSKREYEENDNPDSDSEEEFKVYHIDKKPRVSFEHKHEQKHEPESEEYLDKLPKQKNFQTLKHSEGIYKLPDVDTDSPVYESIYPNLNLPVGTDSVGSNLDDPVQIQLNKEMSVDPVADSFGELGVIGSFVSGVGSAVNGSLNIVGSGISKVTQIGDNLQKRYQQYKEQAKANEERERKERADLERKQEEQWAATPSADKDILIAEWEAAKIAKELERERIRASAQKAYEKFQAARPKIQYQPQHRSIEEEHTHTPSKPQEEQIPKLEQDNKAEETRAFVQKAYEEALHTLRNDSVNVTVIDSNQKPESNDVNTTHVKKEPVSDQIEVKHNINIDKKKSKKGIFHVRDADGKFTKKVV